MDKIWYYMKHDRSKYGPYAEEELIALLKQGLVTADDYIWMADMSAWLKVGDSIYSFYLPAENTTDFDLNL